MVPGRVDEVLSLECMPRLSRASSDLADVFSAERPDIDGDPLPDGSVGCPARPPPRECFRRARANALIRQTTGRRIGLSGPLKSDATPRELTRQVNIFNSRSDPCRDRSSSTSATLFLHFSAGADLRRPAASGCRVDRGDHGYS